MLALGGVVPTFSGDKLGMSISDFFCMLEEIARMGGWSDAQLLGMAKCKMAGAAHDFAWRDENVKAAESFAQFKKLALAYFDTEPQHARLQRFREARQMIEEDVRSYASRLQRLGRDALRREEEGDPQKQKYAEEMLREEMRSQFVAGLRDPVRRFVLSRKPDTFDEAVATALDEERNEALTGTTERVRVVKTLEPSADVALLSERLDRLERLLSQRVEQDLRPPPRQQAFTGGWRSHSGYGRNPRGLGDIVCFACQNRGHIARYCPNQEPQRNSDGPNLNQASGSSTENPKNL